MLCRYILRPPLANERIRLMPDGSVTVEFKRPWSDGTRSIGLEPNALISRLAAIVPPPRRHVTVYSGVLASNSKWRRFVVPKPEDDVRNQQPRAKRVAWIAGQSPVSHVGTKCRWVIVSACPRAEREVPKLPKA